MHWKVLQGLVKRAIARQQIQEALNLLLENLPASERQQGEPLRLQWQNAKDVSTYATVQQGIIDRLQQFYFRAPEWNQPKPKEDKQALMPPYRDSSNRRFAVSKELQVWSEPFWSERGNQEEREKARFLLQSWRKASEFTGYRLWNLLPVSQRAITGVDHRFWGLYNIRPGLEQWVWIAWDAFQERLVVVKEMSPAVTDQASSERLDWEVERRPARPVN